MGSKFEVQAMKIFKQDKEFAVVNVYAPQDALKMDLTPLLTKLGENILLAGDFNQTDPLWEGQDFSEKDDTEERNGNLTYKGTKKSHSYDKR